MPEHTPQLQDESTFVFPDEWRTQIHPRRGGLPCPEISIDPGAVDTVHRAVREVDAGIEAMLNHPESDHHLVDVVRAHLKGEVDPLGAAMVAAMVSAQSHQLGLAVFADAWVSAHGIVFAAEATVELSDVIVHWISAGGQQTPPHIRFRRASDWALNWFGNPIARRMRAILANAEEQTYHTVADTLANHRRDVMPRMVTSYLVPTRQGWVDDLCTIAAASTGQEIDWSMLLCAVGTAEQLAVIESRRELEWHLSKTDVLLTVLDSVGTAIATTLAGLFDRDHYRGDVSKLMLEVLGALPTAEAFDLMLARLDQKHVQPAVLRAMRRYPVRALRLLALTASSTAKIADTATELLRGHVLANPELADATLPGLPDEARSVLAEITRATRRIADAPTNSLPLLLVEPPWTRKPAPAPKPVVIAGLTAPADSRIDWLPDEQRAWAAARRYGIFWQASDWPSRIERLRAGQVVDARQESDMFIDAPEHLVAPLVAGWRPRGSRRDADSVKGVVARFGLDTLPALLHLARSAPAAGELLLPFFDRDVAALMADWLVRVKTARPIAVSWFERHGVPAARFLIPDALGKAGSPRRAAEGALRFLASAGHTTEVIGAAREHGDRAASAIEAMLASEPQVPPLKAPTVGGWADPGLLPQVLLRGRDHALPLTSTKHVITMLAMSKPGEPYPGVDVVKEFCDPESLAEFTWALFRRWQAVGTPAKDGWALTALGCLGNDHTVRRLAPIIRSWPGEGGHSKAVAGLDVLASIGTDVALTHLHDISQKVKFKALKERAQEKIADVADRLGLTADQLGDRLVPDLGLDPAGTLTLDYGPRRFTVGFDENLKPYVADENGKLLKNLPKPGVRDDQELAPSAHKRFSALKKDARTVAADQIRRLEQAMVTQRQWTTTEFQDLLVHHPLLWHIARRLVWSSETGATFRLAEDRGLADHNDDTLILSESVRVCVAHPLHLGDTLDAWSQVFADYEILQPFPQLARTVHTLTDDEKAATDLKRFHGGTVPTGKILGLQRRGWQRGEPQDNGIEPWILKPIAGGRAIVVNLDPGLAVGMLDTVPEQRIEHLWINDQRQGSWRPKTDLTFDELDPVTSSEMLADLTELTTP